MTKPQTNIDLAARMIAEAARLLATSTKTPAKTAASPSRPATPAKTISSRVAALLRSIGVRPEDMRASRNGKTPRGVKAIAARRTIVTILNAEGLSVSELARDDHGGIDGPRAPVLVTAPAGCRPPGTPNPPPPSPPPPPRKRRPDLDPIDRTIHSLVAVRP